MNWKMYLINITVNSSLHHQFKLIALRDNLGDNWDLISL
jgi:hypothetical protein